MKLSIPPGFLMLVLLSMLGFTNCRVVKTLRILNNTDIKYAEYSNGSKDYVFIDMVHVAKPTFYENVENCIAYAKENGYVLYYEYVNFDNSTDTQKRKLKEITGQVSDPEGYAISLKSLLDRGYVILDKDQFLGKVNNLDYNADIDLNELVTAYEEEYGEIEITEKNRNTPLLEPISPSLPQSNVHKILRDYRNVHLAGEIENSAYDKIIVQYGVAHQSGLLQELQKIDSSWEQTPTGLFKEVEMLEPANSIVEDGYIERFEKLGVKLALSNDVEGFSLNGGNNKLKILPNTSTLASIKLLYKPLSLSLFHFYPDLFSDNSDEMEKGKTKNWSIGGNLNFKNWLNNITFSKTRGYYLSNTSDFNPSWEKGDPYIQFPDLEFQGFHGTTGYRLNPKLSFNAVELQTERQLKSVGSFIPRIYYRFFTVDDKTPLTGSNSIQKSRTIELLLGFGYYHTFVHNKFYFSAGLTPSVGKNITKLTTRSAGPEIRSKLNSRLVQLDGTAALGYNGDKIFAGFETQYRSSKYNQGNTTSSIRNSRITYQLFMGYRFKIPKL